MSLNKVMLIGRLGQNPEIKYTPSGVAVSNFSIATNETWTDKSGTKQNKTEWHRLVVWGKLGELCNKYLSKGRQVYVEGKIQTRDWQDKAGQTRYTTEIVVASVQFLGSRESTDIPLDDPKRREEPPNNLEAPDNSSFTEEDVPF